jgi:hypothetical protein
MDDLAILGVIYLQIFIYLLETSKPSKLKQWQWRQRQTESHFFLLRLAETSPGNQAIFPHRPNKMGQELITFSEYCKTSINCSAVTSHAVIWSSTWLMKSKNGRRVGGQNQNAEVERRTSDLD